MFFANSAIVLKFCLYSDHTIFQLLSKASNPAELQQQLTFAEVYHDYL